MSAAVSQPPIFDALFSDSSDDDIRRSRNYDLFSCTARLLLKTASFSVLVLFYTWSWERPDDLVTVFGASGTCRMEGNNSTKNSEYAYHDSIVQIERHIFRVDFSAMLFTVSQTKCEFF